MTSRKNGYPIFALLKIHSILKYRLQFRKSWKFVHYNQTFKDLKGFGYGLLVLSYCLLQ